MGILDLGNNGDPPRRVVVVKLSALGDVLNTLPVVRTLQRVLPQTRITWVIGRAAALLLGSIPDIEFLVLDKKEGRRGRSQIQDTLNAEHIDVVLHMQYAWRASLLVSGIRSKRKIGYDWQRAQDLQWLFTNERIESHPNQHVIDAHFEFIKKLGISDRDWRFDIPVDRLADQKAKELIPDDVPTIIISPCSSHPLRNWNAKGYATVADEMSRQGYRILLCGGQSPLEQSMGAEIVRHMTAPVVNHIGQDTLPEMLATLKRAKMIVTPDSGPAHMGNAVGVPVLGLYAATNPKRSGPYQYIDYCVDRFPAAARKFRGKETDQLPWRCKIEQPGVMDLIRVDDVLERFDAIRSILDSKQ